MFALFSATFDAHTHSYVFASHEDAQRFGEFCQIYMLDSGAGNGYGGVWVSNPETVEVDSIKTGWRPLFDERERGIIDGSARCIVHARSLGSDDGDYSLSIGTGPKGGITFDYVFPERQPVVVWGMYRFRSLGERSEARRLNVPTEGLVIAEEGEQVLVACNYSVDKGVFSDRTRNFAWVRREALFQIDNWMANYRKLPDRVPDAILHGDWPRF